MVIEHPPAVCCAFFLRVPVEEVPGRYRYIRLHVESWREDGYLETPHPPAVGDRIALTDQLAGIDGVFVVLRREWFHTAYESPMWPAGTGAPKRGPLLEIVVEAATSELLADELNWADEAEDHTQV
ncbi:hypothetical protein SAMN05421776_105371 [Nocardia farcinica]|uniref:Uncharacterized protein n=1 Tax=Nocardia farcinica TaxID=37329 RepID=A0A0H5NEP9_NOCFR|nr:hypothetical protein [Nocardia farcinica]AXK88846.1 hypothetical protein DXT66_27340 [Nocardia farcinica]MBA4858049.1 hypothetical protein [Nocardia farcinica]MBC9819420.1 hypothetical protein [Nocardia farcinica]MBF6410894.1 hypothetical protein [Nocardia farcinica]PFX04032.1 hypothetical protein CJ469_01906 [Nocardia farcinica]